MGSVLGSEELKPISWRVWAGKVEREQGGAGPFAGLEDRWGFMDVRVGFLQSKFSLWKIRDCAMEFQLIFAGWSRPRGRSLRIG